MTGAVFDQTSIASHRKIHQKLTELAASGETDALAAYEYLHLDAVNRIPHNGTAVPGRGPLIANMILGGVWHQNSEGKLAKVREQVAALKSLAISAAEKADAESGYANFGGLLFPARMRTLPSCHSSLLSRFRRNHLLRQDETRF